MLDFPSPELKAYPKETVVAEKFEAMVKLGITNNRMKDFWDLQWMIKEFEFEGAVLQKAIQATFERRQTGFPKNPPLALTEEFSNDKGKQTQWNAFLRKNKLESATDFASVIASLKRIFQPVIELTARKENISATWRQNVWHSDV